MIKIVLLQTSDLHTCVNVSKFPVHHRTLYIWVRIWLHCERGFPLGGIKNVVFMMK